jgi:two-component system, OmpR family, osmolarity sensor histidine kinase EnvZ
MLGRLTFAGRLLAMMLFFLLAMVAIGSSIAYISSARSDGEFGQQSLPQQSAAIAKLLDVAGPVAQAAILPAVNTQTLSVTVIAQRQAPSDGSVRVTQVERLVAQQFDETDQRDVIVTLIDPESGRLPKLAKAFAYVRGDQRMRIELPLKSGSFAAFETRGTLITRIYGLPIGFFIGLIGSLAGITTIWAVMREARPLKKLVSSVDHFAENAVPAPVAPLGAPEIKRLIQASNDMQARIAGLIAGRSLFLGAISHDLKTFLTRFRLRIEEIPDDEQRQRAVRDLDDMTRLLDDALIVAKSASVPNRNAVIELRQLLQADVADRPSLRVEIDSTTAGGAFTVTGDSVALRRVFGNVINNALSYGQRCHITLNTKNGWHSIAIADDGPGIAEEERTQVFEPFYRTDRSRSRQTGGSGLGLAIAKQIVEAHGGTIEIQRATLGGALVTIKLPAREP